ncbi:MAG: nuclear transport factor 2 family protein [Acidimicrobiales bacterium]|nr:nuclear transport factor 2 family protein [Acidimicrobiales bacterium]
MQPIDIPNVIEAYQRAHDRHDVDDALASFGPDATVVDDGVDYVGTERIRWWLANAASEYTYTRTFTGLDDLGDGAYVVHNHLSGDFPGGEADLRYRFRLRDGLIRRVEIAP